MPSTFAIVPAAGNSVRMGQPKLGLSLAGRPMIEHTLSAWQASSVDHIVVVVQSLESPLRGLLQSFSKPRSRIEIVTPQFPPPDMKVSIQAALRHIETHHSPNSLDAFLVAPADMPQLSSAVVDLLIERHREDARHILVPTLQERRGHPVLFPWSLVPAVHALAADEGLSALVQRGNALTISAESVVVGPADPFADLDTPEQFERLAREFTRLAGGGSGE